MKILAILNIIGIIFAFGLGYIKGSRDEIENCERFKTNVRVETEKLKLENEQRSINNDLKLRKEKGDYESQIALLNTTVNRLRDSTRAASSHPVPEFSRIPFGANGTENLLATEWCTDMANRFRDQLIRARTFSKECTSVLENEARVAIQLEHLQKGVKQVR